MRADLSEVGTLFEVTLFSTDGDLLSKEISLNDDGTLFSDGSACRMPSGRAERVQFDGLDTFAEFIGSLATNEAIALGSLREDVPESVEITTKVNLAKLNGAARPDLIARSSDYLWYVPTKPAVLLIDFDRKGMPPAVQARIDAAGGDLFGILAQIFPELEQAGRVERASTSAGITRTDTGERLTGSGGLHLYVLVADGRDIERTLGALHDRCRLAGYGWLMVGAAGQLLERSIVDRMVGGAERLVFEGRPELAPPLEQDEESRRPRVFNGQPLETRQLLDLTPVEQSRKRDLWAAEATRLQSDASKARATYVERQAASIMAARPECPRVEAARIVMQKLGGDLLPDVALDFDDAELAGSPVRAVLKDPDRFVGATLADPLEGVGYGVCKAMVMRREDGTLWINSFAHGRTTYELKADKGFIERALNTCDPKDATDTLVRLMLSARVTPAEQIALRDLCCKIGGAKPQPLNQTIKAALAEQAVNRAREVLDRLAIASYDRRVRLPVPKPDAERLPTLRSLDEVLGADTSPSRVMRDLGGHPVEVRVRTPANVHELTAIAANDDESGDDTSRLPAPPMPLLTRHDRLTLGQMIERHIQWLTEPTRFSPPEPVALPTVFLDHYLAYRDSTLPHVASVVTMPLVLPDGTPLDSEGLVERFQWYFCIDPDLQRCIPDPDRCTPREAADALNYLANTFLVDVATDFAGKCVLIAMMMTIIERVLLPERPAFFVTAGKRGGGKTTALCMAMLALTGKKPPAAAWSNNEEERRKAVLSYLRDGLGFIVWDNIPLGSSISCPTIEKVLTSDTYSDRILGETKNLTVPCTTVLGFTGNNISPKGDLSSRSLTTRIEVEQPDPENRPFKHPDPIGWTLDHRGDIINAIYTLLLVKARQPHQGQAKTRFKTWWRLVGRPIELAASELVEIEAQLPEEWRTAKPIDFASLFAAVEADDEEVASLTETLEALHAKWPSGFKAASVLEVITDHTFADEDADILRSFFRSKDGRTQPSTVTIGKRLSELKGTPVLSDAGTLKLVVLPMRDHAREYQVTLRPR